MSSPAEKNELLERVLSELGNAYTDEKFEAAVGKLLTQALLEITSPQENVRTKAIEVLPHIKERLESRPAVQIPVDSLLDQYLAYDSSSLLNDAITYITMGFPRLPVGKQVELMTKLLNCIEKIPYSDEDKYGIHKRILVIVLTLLCKVKLPADVAERKLIFGLSEKPNTKKLLFSLIQDFLLLPYDVTPDAELPTVFSTYSFGRIIANNWKAEELEQLKKGIVRFIGSGALSDLDTFMLLVLASSDTRFSVATTAIAELSKVCTSLDFSEVQITGPFSSSLPEDGSKVVKLFQYFIKGCGEGINAVKEIQVIFEELFGENTNQKCKVLSLQFCEVLLKEGPKEIISRVSKVILTGLSKLIGKESAETTDVQNAAYSAMAQLARICPEVVNQDLKIVVSYFNHLSTAPEELQPSIREALIATAQAFVWNYNSMETKSTIEFVMSEQQNLLLAMLSDNTEAKLQVVQNVTSFFLMNCFPDHFVPARFLLLLIAGEKSSSLHETVTSYLYGVSKKDHINYYMISSVDNPVSVNGNGYNKLSSEKRLVTLPGFKEMVNHVSEMAEKRLLNSTQRFVVGKLVLPFLPNVYCEILDYLRLCLWYSTGARCQPGTQRYIFMYKKYVRANYREIVKYFQLVKTSVVLKREDTNLLCLYDLLKAVPELISPKHIHLLESLAISLKDVSVTLRILVAQVYGTILAYCLADEDSNKRISEMLSSMTHKSLENRHGIILLLGHAFSIKIRSFKESKDVKYLAEWKEFIQCLQFIVSSLLESQVLLISASIKSLSLIYSEVTELPDFEVVLHKKVSEDAMEVEEIKMCAKDLAFETVFGLVNHSSVRSRIREDAATCIGNLAIGDGKRFTKENLENFLKLIKVPKNAALNIAIAQAIVFTINGYDTNLGLPNTDFKNQYCDDETLDWFLREIINHVPEPNPHSRQACGIWLLAIVKNCPDKKPIACRKQLLQYAFSELLCDDTEFVQDVASHGLGLVYPLSDSSAQKFLANWLINQLIGGRRQVNKISEETELYAEGVLAKIFTGRNITAYNEICGLVSDLNKHSAKWNSKLGAGLRSISKETKIEMQPYLGKIVPRLYRYKYDPIPKIQNKSILIWDAIVNDSKEIVELYYWEILKELLVNMTNNEWRNRIACCLAVRDLLKRPNGLNLRSDEIPKDQRNNPNEMETDEIPEPELAELWAQLFRVMDDFHEGTRLAAEGTAKTLSKICVTAASSNHGKSGVAVVSSILPLLLNVGITHTVAEIRRLSIKTLYQLIDVLQSRIRPHLPTSIPCLLRVTGEFEVPSVQALETFISGDTEAQEAVDSIRAKDVISHYAMLAIEQCVIHVDYECLQRMTPAVLDLVKTTDFFGTKIGCAHFICLISYDIRNEMTPLVGEYLAAFLIGLNDENPKVREEYADTISHLTELANEESIKILFRKLSDLYNEDPSNKDVLVQSINEHHHELLKDYVGNVFPLIFFEMHEGITDDNKATVKLCKKLYHGVSSGDDAIRLNLSTIVPVIEKALEDPSWIRKTQGANAINTIATRLGSKLKEEYRLTLIDLLVSRIPGRTFQGKERLLEATVSLCKGLNRGDSICSKVIDIIMIECRKEEPQYRTHSLKAIGNILEELQVDRFEIIYNMVWHILDNKSWKTGSNDDDDMIDMTTDERIKRAIIFNKLKETACETLGKSWPKNATETQQKYQQKFVELCANYLKDSTHLIQLSLLVALRNFVDKSKPFEVETSGNEEKKRECIVEQILSAIFYASNLPHTELKKESLNIVLLLIKKLAGEDNKNHLDKVKDFFVTNLVYFEKDKALAVRDKIMEVKEKLSIV